MIIKYWEYFMTAMIASVDFCKLSAKQEVVQTQSIFEWIREKHWNN